ncbi:hypothetical protein QBC34DRAFT_411469 [Podospora aff. communis PSN243]|uniref:CFEM domain-containing protein n=1 Tax=Podospora aff. communis PSN243 TaxID=3040156 RepID=A0AAV9GHS4_9PEZI|nr:hypothetical protein QBC34DRAFT_411469 [Podospora aff. communis PSN243]
MPSQLQTFLGALAVAAGPALAQFTPTSTFTPGQQPSVTMATAPNSQATGLPRLVEQLPPCAVPCFESAAKAIHCQPTDFSCLCKPGSAQSLALNVGTCIGGPALFDGNSGSRNDTDAANDGCELDDLDDLSKLAGQICAAVAATPNQSDLAAATSIVSEAIAKASATGTGDGTGAGRQNNAGRAGQASVGMLAIVAGYAVFFL